MSGFETAGFGGPPRRKNTESRSPMGTDPGKQDIRTQVEHGEVEPGVINRLLNFFAFRDAVGELLGHQAKGTAEGAQNPLHGEKPPQMH